MTQKREEKKKTSMYIFPAVLIALDVGAAIMCFIGKDYKKRILARGGGAEYMRNFLTEVKL